MPLTHELKPRIRIVSDGRPWTTKITIIDENEKEMSCLVKSAKWELDANGEPEVTLVISGRLANVDLMAALKHLRVVVMNED